MAALACVGTTHETGQRHEGAQSVSAAGACSLQQVMAQVSTAAAGETWTTGVAGAIGAKTIANRAGMTAALIMGKTYACVALLSNGPPAQVKKSHPTRTRTGRRTGRLKRST